MQSDAFPTPSIYCHYFEPRLLISPSEEDLPSQAQYIADLPTKDQSKPDKELRCTQLLNEIEQLITDSTEEQSQFFGSLLITSDLSTRLWNQCKRLRIYFLI
jgi:hypothetical protein